MPLPPSLQKSLEALRLVRKRPDGLPANTSLPCQPQHDVSIYGTHHNWAFFSQCYHRKSRQRRQTYKESGGGIFCHRSRRCQDVFGSAYRRTAGIPVTSRRQGLSQSQPRTPSRPNASNTLNAPDPDALQPVALNLTSRY